MRRCYSMRGGSLVVREVRMFSSTTSVVENEAPEITDPKQIIEESLARWSSRRTFSIASIDIRLKEARKNYKERLKRIFRDYSRYANTKLKPEDMDNFVAMLDNDLMTLITAASDDIARGTSLVTILGLGALGRDLKKLGQKFTIAYRKSLKALDKTGTVTPNIYRQVDETLNALIDAIHLEILGTEGYETYMNPIKL